MVAPHRAVANDQNSNRGQSMRTTDLLKSVALAALLASATTAMAQVTEGNLSPQTRAPLAESNQLEQVGARAGSFRILPRIEIGALTDDNVYATETRTQSDTVFRAAPSLQLTSETSRYTLNLRGGIERLEYDDLDDESRTNYGFGTDLTTEVVRDTRLKGRLNYDVGYEDRGQPNAVSGNRAPVKFKTFDTGVAFDRDVSRVLLGLEANYRNLDFNDAVRNNGTIDNNDDRDRKLVLLGGKLGYEISPGYNFIGRIAYDTVNYDSALDDDRFDRDSKGFRATGGIGFELSRLLTGDVFLGYVSRNYDDARLPKISDVAFGAGLTWSPNEMTSIRLTADRTIEETVILGYSGYINTSFDMRMDYELTRQLTINAGLRYAKNKYERTIGATVPRRSDDNTGSSVGIRYALNRLLYASAGYEFAKRSSDIVATDFSRNKFLVTVGAQF
jgi:hypothetical protein